MLWHLKLGSGGSSSGRLPLHSRQRGTLRNKRTRGRRKLLGRLLLLQWKLVLSTRLLRRLLLHRLQVRLRRWRLRCGVSRGLLLTLRLLLRLLLLALCLGRLLLKAGRRSPRLATRSGWAKGANYLRLLLLRMAVRAIN